jgi:hypothetical protein
VPHDDELEHGHGRPTGHPVDEDEDEVHQDEGGEDEVERQVAGVGHHDGDGHRDGIEQRVGDLGELVDDDLQERRLDADPVDDP